MSKLQLFALLLLIVFLIVYNLPSNKNLEMDFNQVKRGGALLTTRFNSFEDLKEVVKIEYTAARKSKVSLTHFSNNGQVNSILKSGIS